MGDEKVVVMHQPGLRKRSFMSPSDLRRIRQSVLRLSQKQLADQLIDPNDGRKVPSYKVYRWEAGRVLVPLWAARIIKAMEEEARKYDMKEEATP